MIPFPQIHKPPMSPFRPMKGARSFPLLLRVPDMKTVSGNVVGVASMWLCAGGRKKGEH